MRCSTPGTHSRASAASAAGNQQRVGVCPAGPASRCVGDRSSARSRRDQAEARRQGHAHDHARPGAAAIAHEHSHAASPKSTHSSIGQRSRRLRKLARRLWRLGEAEAAIHQIPVEKIHLHEVGALDSIIDIVGAVFALEWFKADRIVSSPLNVGGGMVQSAHGLFPVPAPATVKLLEGVPVYSSGIKSELVTPTGALLISSYATAFGPMPAMTIDRVGYGAGDRDTAETPNVLRVMVGQSHDQLDSDRPNTEPIIVIECEIDDMNPQIFGSVMDTLYAAGALELLQRRADEEESAGNAADDARKA